jgi:iron complex outermembrane receptor protein
MVSQVDANPSFSSEENLSDLTELSIEELANIEVISGSRTPQRLSMTPAAIFVVTAEDIRRSGVTSIPEALRMVPGVEVARVSSSKWAVSSRGFNSRYSNKLLVLIDGRCIYLPLFSGVFWENQDVFLEDIERIEFIRGPGASLWGANAVNGIINIITKNSNATEGKIGRAHV